MAGQILPAEEKLPHTLTLEGRKSLKISGILDVDSCDEHTITARTSMGVLTIEGDGLHVRKLSLEEGILLADGTVSSLYYTEESIAGNGGFFSKLFR